MGFTIGMALKVTILCSTSLGRLVPASPRLLRARNWRYENRRLSSCAAAVHHHPGLAMNVLPGKAVVPTALWKSYLPPSKYILGVKTINQS